MINAINGEKFISQTTVSVSTRTPHRGMAETKRRTTANNAIIIMREKLDKARFKVLYKPRLEEMNKFRNFRVAGLQSEARTKDISTLNQV